MNINLTQSQITEQNNRELEDELNFRSTLLLLDSEKFIQLTPKIEETEKERCAMWHDIIVKLKGNNQIERKRLKALVR